MGDRKEWQVLKFFEARGYNDPEGWPAPPETYRIGIFVSEQDAVKAARGKGGSQRSDGKVEPIQVYETYDEFAAEQDRKQKEDEQVWQKRISIAGAIYRMDLALDYVALKRHIKG